VDLPEPPWRSTRRAPARRPLSQDLVVDTALALLAREGLDAVSMRRVAAELGTGPASLYAHVRNKDELHELMLERVLATLPVPQPDPAHWRTQLKQALKGQVDALVAHPGMARIALAMIVPGTSHTLAQAELILGLLRAGGVPDELAAVGFDVLTLYATAFAHEASAIASGEWDRDEIAERGTQIGQYVAALPDRFPNLLAIGPLLGAGNGEQRLDLALDVIIAGLAGLAGR
jgi:AcrR family transcriptional regulator